MSENPRTHLIDVPIGGTPGLTWNRLHEEREEICEALIKAARSELQVPSGREQLEERLMRIDNALDRVIVGSYGICSTCDRTIEEGTLEIDPAWTLCMDCWTRDAFGDLDKIDANTDTECTEMIDLESLNPFDTILLHTLNSEYRVFLLNPKTGHALVEGGSYLAQPDESFIFGSAKKGVICAGSRLKMWVDGKMLSTSIVQSIEVKRCVPSESVPNVSVAVH